MTTLIYCYWLLVSMILIVGVWHLPSVDMVTEFVSAFEVIGTVASGADSEDSVADFAAPVAVLLADTVVEVSIEIAVVEMLFGSEIWFSRNVVCVSLLITGMFYDKL